MPSPGKSDIEDAIAGTRFDVGDETTEFKAGSTMVVKLGKAIDAGWTSVSPATATAIATAFSAEFTNLVGNGLAVMNAIAAGIDQETAAWVASFNTQTSKHTYAPTAATIKAKMLAAMPISSNGIDALAQACADAFMDGFDPSAG